jgi:predicted kinase
VRNRPIDARIGIVLKQSVRDRHLRGDASDASAEVLRLQLGHDPGALDWTRIDAGGDPDETLAAARRALGN